MSRENAPRFDSPELPTVPHLEGYHVTDDPQPVFDALRTGAPIDRGRDTTPHDDLLASGLYFSEFPKAWMGRASNKWRFTESLDETQRTDIARAILQDSRFKGGWYLTESEKERAVRWLDNFTESGNAVYLQFLADQPYNFASWRSEFLEQFGAVNEKLPQVVPVLARGLFADITRARISSELIVGLKYSGFDGVFVRGSIAFVDQSVVWNNGAVVQFGEYLGRPTEER